MIVFTGPSFWDILCPVPALPAAGSVVDVTAPPLERAGGNAPAAAAWAATGRGPAALIAPGAGRLGRRLRAAVSAAGPEAAWLPGEPARCLVLTTPDGERTMVNLDPVAAPEGRMPARARSLLRRAATVWIDWDCGPTAEAVRAACEDGVVAAVPVRHLHRERAAGRRCDVVVGSAAQGRPPAAELRRAGCVAAAVTDGARGGDAFTAGFLAALAAGRPPGAAAAAGARLGAAACTAPGSFPG